MQRGTCTMGRVGLFLRQALQMFQITAQALITGFVHLCY